jgi:cAMP-binding proteins - catabolite gene activator and regulatory subunit of cAMP-dependent protein kinases
MKDIALIIKESPLFKGLTTEELEDVLKDNYKEVCYAKGDLVALQGDPCRSLMMILDGTVRSDMTDPAGKLVTIATLTAPDILAPAFIYAARNEFPVDITAMTDLTLMVIGRESFSKLLQQHITVLNNFLRMISDQTQFLTQKIRFLQFGTMKKKLASYFVERLASVPGIEFQMEESQQALADRFGVTRPALARAIGEMVSDGIIQVEKKKVTVVNAVALKQMAAREG